MKSKFLIISCSPTSHNSLLSAVWMHQAHSFLRVFLAYSEWSAVPSSLALLRSCWNITSSERRQAPHWPLAPPLIRSHPPPHCLILPSSQQLLILPINLFICVFNCCLPLCSKTSSTRERISSCSRPKSQCAQRCLTQHRCLSVLGEQINDCH